MGRGKEEEAKGKSDGGGNPAMKAATTAATAAVASKATQAAKDKATEAAVHKAADVAVGKAADSVKGNLDPAAAKAAAEQAAKK